MDLYKHMQRSDMSLTRRLALLGEELDIPKASRICVVAHREGIFKGRSGTHAYVWKPYDAELTRRLRRLLGQSVQYDSRVEAHHVAHGAFETRAITDVINRSFTHVVSQFAHGAVNISVTGRELRQLIIEDLPIAEPALFADVLPAPIVVTVKELLEAARTARVFDGRHTTIGLRLFEVDADLAYHSDHSRTLRSPGYRSIALDPEHTLALRAPLAVFRLDVRPGAPRAFSYNVVTGVAVNRGPLETNSMRRFESMLVASTLYAAKRCVTT